MASLGEASCGLPAVPPPPVRFGKLHAVMRHYVTYGLLLALRGLSRLLYRVDLNWLGSPCASPKSHAVS
jgi:hypothetical protein